MRLTRWLVPGLVVAMLAVNAGAQPRDNRIRPNQPYQQPLPQPRQPSRVPSRQPQPQQQQPKPDQKPSEPWWAPRSRLGIAAIEATLRARTPVGRGVTAAHVEGAPGSYMPNPQQIQGARFVGKSGPSDANGHALATARILYGRESLSPGITDVHCYATNHWLGEGFLRTGTPFPPREDDRRIYNHSWIGQGSPFDAQILRRVDWVVDTRDVIMVVGVNNGKDTSVPALLSSAYNVIAVGSNASSGGYTRVEGQGRCKPDIIAPTPLTSFATPMVGAIAARLLEMGNAMVAEARPQNGEQTDESKLPVKAFANKSQVIRAVLFAGAHKPAGWTQAEGRPFDEHMGAGRVRFDRSYFIMSNPLASPDSPMGEQGWHYGRLKAGETINYELNVPQGGGELSIVLVWNRRIDGRTMHDPVTQQPMWIDLPRLADLDLTLLDAANPNRVVAASTSRVDNVEHIYQRRATPGRYTVRISRHDNVDESWDYALAWRLTRDDPGSSESDEPDEGGTNDSTSGS